VLAHEIAHIVHRHAIRHLREERNKDLWKRIAVVTAPLVLGPLLAPLGVSVGGTNPIILLQRPSIEYFLADQALDSSLDLSARRPAKGRFDQTVALFARTQPQLALLASVQNYQSSLMEEADRFTITALVQAGYDPEEADRTLARLHQVASAQVAQEPFWWGRPTVLEARRRVLHKAVAALPRPQGEQRPQVSRLERYPERIRFLLRENALAELKLGRSDAAIAQLDRALSLYPHDATAHYYRGRAYAAKAATTNDLQHAIAAYQTAAKVDSGFAAAYRELALTYGKLGEVERASAARQTYLSLQGGMALLPMTRADGPVMRPALGIEAGIPPLSPP
jgi:predicted Zn-dependent protease